jgi:6-phosphogluconolactonase (cycloisomerase 2 family)
LTPVSGSPFSAGPAPGAGGIAIDPQTRFLYITLLNSSAVEGYTIDAASGALTPIPGSPFPAGNTPMHAIVDPGGKFLYVSNYNDAMGTISAFAIDSATGVLTAVAGSPFATQANFPGPSAFAFAGSGKFLYVGLAGTVNGNDLIAGFAVNTTTGALTQLGGSPFTGDFNPQQLAADATGKFLFSANLAAGTVSVFTIDNDSGALTLVNNFDAGGAADSLTLDPTNGFLFVGTQQAITGAAPNGISVFSLDTSTGNLSSIQGSPFATGQYYYGLAIAKP